MGCMTCPKKTIHPVLDMLIGGMCDVPLLAVDRTVSINLAHDPDRRMETTPVSLLERLRDRTDQAAWTRFVFLYSPLFYLWARRLGAIGSDADDLVQDVFTALVRDLPRFQYDPGQRFRGWLWRIVRNKAKDRQRIADPIASNDLDAVPDRVNADPGVAVDEREYQRYLAGRALELIQSEFEPSTWRAFLETTADGRSPSIVAAELGVTENAVYLARSRVLRRLRAELAGLFDD
jgi:RNA polymerase sigma-70 factor (ECF subfamily)